MNFNKLRERRCHLGNHTMDHLDTPFHFCDIWIKGLGFNDNG